MVPTEEKNNPSDDIDLSRYTRAFLSSLSEIQTKKVESDMQPITVSQTVSFFAFLYERARNAIEFREEHLIRRAAIERILNRRLSMNIGGRGEGENLVRELLWARYVPSDSMSESEVQAIQSILDKYLYLRSKSLSGRDSGTKSKINDALIQFLTCEIEEQLDPERTARSNAFRYFFYQVLKNKIAIKDVDKTTSDSYFYIASEQAFARNDKPYIRYHIFQLMHDSIHTMGQQELDELAAHLPKTIAHIDSLMQNRYNERLVRFARKHVPPFRILFALVEEHGKGIIPMVQSKKLLWQNVDEMCHLKYEETGKKLKIAAVRSIVYIFLTKALFALILEFPVSKILEGGVNYMAIAINTIFPPLMMAAIVSFVSVPDEANTKRIYNRIIDILNRDPSFETAKTTVSAQIKVKRPVMVLGFTILYALTFWITFSLIYLGLDLLGFHLVSKLIFMFFISVVAFFGYRVRQTAKEYFLDKRDSTVSPLVDIFFIPIVSVGKTLSQEISKINVLIFIFDFLIEAPFKLLFEIVEEWINFVKARKEEII